MRSSTSLLALVGSIVALSLGCMGLSTPPKPSESTAEPIAPVMARRPESMVGAWRMIPDERRLRELRIVEAATSGKDAQRERLGDLTPQEQALFDLWREKKGSEVEQKLRELQRVRSYVMELTDDAVTLQFEPTERFGPVPYTVVATTPASITIAFDPGLGHGVETHEIRFESPTRGQDTVTTADGRRFDPVAIVRR